MNAHFLRGSLLYEQGRYRDAIGELQLHLGAAAEDAPTHALLAQCFLELDELKRATEHAQRAVHLEPENSVGHRALAVVLLERNRFAEALAGATEAVRLDPWDPHLFALLAQVQMQRNDWRAVLNAANAGLELDPEHTVCQNLRAIAQVHLGDREAAAHTTKEALARRPDDALTHANEGWTLLHRGQPRQAAEHFREALRLQPDLEWARAGIVEAMKARNPIYRWLLSYFLWLSRMPSRQQWMIILGLYVASRFIDGAARDNPAARPYLLPLSSAYLVFALSTWLADAFFNLLLRLDRFGRYCLSSDQKRGANLFAAWMCCTLALAAYALTSSAKASGMILLVFIAAFLPASVLFRCSPGWPRKVILALTAVNLAAAAYIVSPLLLPTAWLSDDYMQTWKQVAGLLKWVLILSQLAAIQLQSVRVRK